MNEEQIKDMRLQMELSNPAYDIVDKAITHTMKKHNYKEYDLVKLVIMMYKDDYAFISNDNGYREELMLLADYFKKEYNHNLITFEMIKTIINVKKDEYNFLAAEIAQIENILRTNDDNKYLIEFQIKGSNKLNRLLFTEDYILNNPNYLDTEDLPIRDKNMLEAIKKGNIIVSKVWRKKRERVSYTNIEEKFKEENLQHEFMITGKSPNPRHSTIKFIEDENGNIHTYLYQK